MSPGARITPVLLSFALASVFSGTVWAEAPADQAPAPGVKKKREPPPAPIPTEETNAALAQYKAGNYLGAVSQSKLALNKNERYTPAMFIMAKAYYKLKKYEWTKTLWEMMKANNAPAADQAEMYQILAFMQLEQKNVPGAIELIKKATEQSPENAIIWNNLGAQYLSAKNFREAVPALEKSTQLQPGFAKAQMNLGSAYRGLKDYEKAKACYDKALQLFPNYADAVFNLGLLYLDADKIPNMDLTAKMNTAIGYLEKYKQMMQAAGGVPTSDPANTYILEAQEGIKKEEKRIERIKKAEEREKQRAAQKAAQAAKAGAAAPADAPAPGKPEGTSAPAPAPPPAPAGKAPPK